VATPGAWQHLGLPAPRTAEATLFDGPADAGVDGDG
jgi:hypothetical protein